MPWTAKGPLDSARASAKRAPWVALLCGSLLLIVMATTMPWSVYFVGHAHWGSVEWIPFSQRVRLEDFVLNVLLFVPFGYSASRLRGPRSPALLVVIAAALISTSVEVFQVFCHGRIATTTDILANTLGALVGTAVRHD